MATIYSELPAQGFRIFELHPARSIHDALSGELITAQITTAPRYNALSYVWGKKEGDPGTVLISGSDVQISPYLNRALRQIRDPTKTLQVWVDQLCIDQKNANEKAQQIGLMNRIFSQAQEVMVILCACNMNAKVHPLPEEVPASLPPEMAELSGLPLETHLSQTSFGADIALLAKIIAPFRCEWWVRMWTAQEMIVAQNLTCFWHGKQYPIAVLEHVCRWWYSHLGSCCQPKDDSFGMVNSEFMQNMSQIQDLFTLRNQYLRSPKSFNILDLLLCTQDREATEPHDKIYALIGMVHLPPEMIDYSMPVEECYRRTAKHIIQTTRKLDVFRFLNSATPLPSPQDLGKKDTGLAKRLLQLPSWVPDWSILRNGICQRRLDDYNKRMDNFCASKDMKAVISADEDTQLTLKGIRCATIVEVHQDLELIQHSINNWFEFWLVFGGQDRIPYDTINESMFNESDWFSLCAGVLGQSKNQKVRLSLLKSYYLTAQHNPISKSDRRVEIMFKKLLREQSQDPKGSGFTHSYLRRITQGEASSDEKQRKKDADQSHMIMELYFLGKQFITTSDGAYGIAPSAAQPGDTVCILYGGSTPFVISEVRTQTGNAIEDGKSAQPVVEADEKAQNREVGVQYRMIGDAYVHGLMCGEAVDDLRKGTKAEEVFVLV